MGRTGVRVTMACIVDHKHKDLLDHECADRFVVMVTVSHTDNSFVVMVTVSRTNNSFVVTVT